MNGCSIHFQSILVYMFTEKEESKGDAGSWKCLRAQRLFIQHLTTLWFHKTGHGPAPCGGLIPVRLGLRLTEMKAEDSCLEQFYTAESHSSSNVHVYSWTCEIGEEHHQRWIRYRPNPTGLNRKWSFGERVEVVQGIIRFGSLLRELRNYGKTVYYSKHIGS